MVSGEFIEVYAAVDQFRIRRLDKVTRGKIPLAENLHGILRDVLHDIVASGFVILINGNTGGIAILPVRHIVDRLAAIRGQGLSGMGIAGALLFLAVLLIITHLLRKEPAHAVEPAKTAPAPKVYVPSGDIVLGGRNEDDDEENL